MKLCTYCERQLVESEFTVRRASPDGLSYKCRDCSRAYNKGRYALNREAAKNRARKWVAANPERRKEIAAASADKHRDKKRAQSREYQKRLRRENPQLARELGRRAMAVRRARLNSAGVDVSASEWSAMIEIFEYGTCLYCGSMGNKLVMDHFIPVSRGGPTALGNLLPCCRSCNASKSNKMPEDWCTPTAYSAAKFMLKIFERDSA